MEGQLISPGVSNQRQFRRSVLKDTGIRRPMTKVGSLRQQRKEDLRLRLRYSQTASHGLENVEYWLKI